MRPWLVGLCVLLSPSAFAQSTSAPELPFDSVPNFIKLPPDMHLGEASGVAVNSKGNVYVYSRGGTVANAFGATASQILEFDRDGGFIREVGKNLYAWAFAHTVRVDKDDNIWAVDEGTNMIIKFNPEGRVTMILGRRIGFPYNGMEPSVKELNPAPPYILKRPTDVAFDLQGNKPIEKSLDVGPGQWVRGRRCSLRFLLRLCLRRQRIHSGFLAPRHERKRKQHCKGKHGNNRAQARRR